MRKRDLSPQIVQATDEREVRLRRPVRGQLLPLCRMLSQDTCLFAKPEECHEWKLDTFDLKQFYDTCIEEQSVDDYIADLLLTSSEKPNREPVLIDIQVSHKSTDQKLQSGQRIIEIRIKTEEDIKSLLSFPIVENPDTQFGYIRDIETFGFASSIISRRKPLHLNRWRNATYNDSTYSAAERHLLLIWTNQSHAERFTRKITTKLFSRPASTAST